MKNIGVPINSFHHHKILYFIKKFKKRSMIVQPTYAFALKANALVSLIFCVPLILKLLQRVE